MSFRPWLPTEDALLEQGLANGLKGVALAAFVGRSTKSVQARRRYRGLTEQQEPVQRVDDAAFVARLMEDGGLPRSEDVPGLGTVWIYPDKLKRAA